MSNLINQNLISTSELAKQLHTTNDVVLKNARIVLPNKIIENGKTTYWDEVEATMIIDYMKKHISNSATFELKSKVQNTTTTMSNALKIQQAMIMMQEAYEDELRLIKEKNEQLENKNAILQKKQDAYNLLTQKRISKQELYTKYTRAIRSWCLLQYGVVNTSTMTNTYHYWYGKLSSWHCIREDINSEFLKKNLYYVKELLEAILSELKC